MFDRQSLETIFLKFKSGELSLSDAVTEVERQWPEPKIDYKLDNR